LNLSHSFYVILYLISVFICISLVFFSLLFAILNYQFILSICLHYLFVFLHYYFYCYSSIIIFSLAFLFSFLGVHICYLGRLLLLPWAGGAATNLRHAAPLPILSGLATASGVAVGTRQ
jgi:hypothetical protein